MNARLSPPFSEPSAAQRDGLALGRWGLRFSQPQTEAAWRDWSVRRALPVLRAGGIASGVGWLLSLIPLRLAAAEAFSPAAAWVLGVMMPVIVACLAVSFRPGLLGWLNPLLTFATSLAGFTTVGGAMLLLDLPAASTAGAIMCAYFATAVMRLSLAQAAIAVVPYVGFHQWLVVAAYRAGHLGPTELAIHSFLPWISVEIGLLACVANERASREAYRQERIIEEQKQVIQRERERADGLLANILPGPIAERLKQAPEVIADRFDEVTVLFADVVGFTHLAARVTPERLVEVLNEIFTRFDTLAERHGVEKIKTIGDAYMAVAGVPRGRTDHAAAAAELALAMRAAIAEQAWDGIHVRIGLCSGPVVAGVIGTRKFAYDLWGDTVNTAARMESHGLPGEIQVAESTWLRLRDTHRLQERGEIEVKGKGPMRTWLLLGGAGSATAPETPPRRG